MTITVSEKWKSVIDCIFHSNTKAKEKIWFFEWYNFCSKQMKMNKNNPKNCRSSKFKRFSKWGERGEMRSVYCINEKWKWVSFDWGNWVCLWVCLWVNMFQKCGSDVPLCSILTISLQPKITKISKFGKYVWIECVCAFALQS